MHHSALGCLHADWAAQCNQQAAAAAIGNCGTQGLPHHHGIDGGSAAIARDRDLCSVEVVSLEVALLLADPVVTVHCIKIVLQAGEPLQGQLQVASHLVPAAARQWAQHCGREPGIASWSAVLIPLTAPAEEAIIKARTLA